MANRFDTGLRDADGELPPDVLVIAHDDYHAAHVGTTLDGRQFFVTTPFVSGSPGRPGSEFAARYLFDRDGVLVDSTIVPLGTRPGNGSLPGNVASFTGQDDAVERLIEEISPVSLGDITIAPFSVTSHGHEFGLILHGPDLADNDSDEWYWSVSVEPGDYMAFSAPWDDGDYET